MKSWKYSSAEILANNSCRKCNKFYKVSSIPRTNAAYNNLQGEVKAVPSAQNFLIHVKTNVLVRT